ncbi:MAG: bifunctional diguanylate cyclase/phosphodiesterase [Nitrospirota bacterium]
MKVLIAADALHQPVLRVSGEMRPADCREQGVSLLYAVFAETDARGDDGSFLGLVASDDVARFPHRIFADLIPPHSPQPIALDTSLEDVLAKMDGGEAVAVLGTDGRFAGAVTRTSLFASLLNHERILRDESQRLRHQAEDDRKRLLAWSARLEELHAASTNLLGLLAMQSLEGDLLQRGIDALTALVQARYGAVGIFDDTSGLARFFYTGLSPEDADRIGQLPQGRGLLGAVLRENRPLRIDDLTRDPRAAGFPPNHPVMRSLLAVPISYRGQVFGRVYLCDKTTDQPFSDHDELLATSFAESLALVMANARAQAERKQHERTMAGYNRTLELLATGAALPNVLLALVQAIEHQYTAGPCSALVVDPTGTRLRLGAGPSLPAAYNRAIDGIAIGPGVGSCGTAAYRKELVAVDDIETDPLWEDFRHLALSHGLRACWSHPILSSDRRVLGTFAMYAGSRYTPTEADLKLLATAAQMAGIAIERTRAEESLRTSEYRLRSIVTSSADGIVTIDERGIVDSFNPAAERLFGYPASEVVGRNVSMLMIEPDRSAHDEYIRRYAATGQGRIIGVGPREVIGLRKDGSTFPMDLAISEMRLDDGPRFVGIVRDITERKRAQERLDHLAHYDALTGLPNRLLLQDRLTHAVINATRHQRVVGVMFLDLDRFKTINDTLGHEVGDDVLKTVAERLNRCVREGDSVARLGGDEYAIVLADMAHAEDAANVARRILDEFSQPVRFGRHELYATASIGITLYPTDDDRVEHLLKNADTAMYRAKETGRNTYQFYTADMNAKAIERLDLETNLRRAQERDEFRLHYQPQIDLSTGRIVGVEALIRWSRPDRGMVPPVEFIPVAEETGLITSIGQWVLRAALTQTKTWRDAGLSLARVSVNVSPRQFRQPDFPASVARMLLDANIPAHWLEIEVTESLLLEHEPTVLARFTELRELGIRFSIDDFGTGYSSLSYLKRFPIDTLKIDRSFVANLPADPDHSAIASAIVSLAHSLRLQVIAEGVETATQAEFLRSLGCDFAQGYFYSRPLPADAVESLMSQGGVG